MRLNVLLTFVIVNTYIDVYNILILLNDLKVTKIVGTRKSKIYII